MEIKLLKKESIQVGQFWLPIQPKSGSIFNADSHRLSFAERFGLIVDRQWTWKENNRMARYLKNARPKLNACIEDIDYKSPAASTSLS